MWPTLLFLWGHVALCAQGDAEPEASKPTEDAGPSAEDSVRRFRVEAEVAFQNREYAKAIKFYNKMIKLEKTDESYHSRAMVHLVVNNFKRGFSDLDKALKLNPKHVQSLFWRAKTNRKFGKCTDALLDLRRVLQIEPNHVVSLTLLKDVDECVDLMAKVERRRKVHDCNGAQQHMERLLEITQYNKENNLFYSTCMFERQDYQSSLKYAGNVLKGNDQDLDALLIRGKAYYHLDELDRALQHWKKGLKSDPEHKELKKHFKKLRKVQKHLKRAESLKNERKWNDAVDAYTDAMEVDPEHLPSQKRISAERCATAIRHFQYDKKKRVEHCLAAQKFDQESAEAYGNLGKAHALNEDWEKAKYAYDNAVRKNPRNNDYRKGLQDAEFELKKARRKDYYAILGIEKTAAHPRQIKKGFRKCGLEFHPDKCQTEECDKKFKDCVEANEILSDPDMRQRYDAGQDVLGDMQSGGRNQGGGHGHPFNFGGGGQRFHFHRG